MKVLICIPCLLTGGTEIQTLNTVHALVQGGHEVTVACYFEHTPYMVERYRKAGAEVILFSPEGARTSGYRTILYLYKHLRHAIRMVRPDVAHVQYMAPGATVILLLWLMGVKNIIATAHTAADIYKDLRLIHFLQCRCLRAWTCITERAERSFFGTSQLYTPATVLGKRNHFTIYNALPFRCSERLKAAEQRLIATASQVNVAEQRLKDTQSQGDDSPATPLRLTSSTAAINDNDPPKSSPLTAHRSQPIDSVQDNLTQNTQTSQNGKSLTPLLASGVSGESSLLTAHRSQPNTLGVVSRLEAIKGMDLVVPAFAEVLKQHPDTQLLVVGDGSLRASMEQQAVELGCADHITWVGRQPQEELPQWYGQMDIVLMPSRSEGFGLTAIEAMASGCVMVASNVGGLPEVVHHGECGLLHRTEDIADMASQVCTLINDKELYDRLQAQSLREVEKYSFERYAELVNNLYTKLHNK